MIYKSHRPNQALHSFPTRRSSDLGKEPEVSPSSRLIKNPRFLPAVATDRYLIKGSAEDHGSERGLPTIRPLVATSAFVDRKSTRLNSSHRCISYAVFCLKKKKKKL